MRITVEATCSIWFLQEWHAFLSRITAAKAAFQKDQIGWARHNPGNSVGTTVERAWLIRFGVKPSSLWCTEVVWGLGWICDCRSGFRCGVRWIWVWRRSQDIFCWCWKRRKLCRTEMISSGMISILGCITSLFPPNRYVLPKLYLRLKESGDSWWGHNFPPRRIAL